MPYLYEYHSCQFTLFLPVNDMPEKRVHHSCLDQSGSSRPIEMTAYTYSLHADQVWALRYTTKHAAIDLT